MESVLDWLYPMGIEHSGDCAMSTQNTIAGLLTAFGLLGLAFAPSQSPSQERSLDAHKDRVTLAISMGSKLRLETDSLRHAPKIGASNADRSMVCADVYRLTVADVGVDCRNAANTRAVALVN